MNRDDLPFKIHGKNVTVGQTDITTSGTQNSASQTIHYAHRTPYYLPLNTSTAASERFYSSYNPEVGINTATILGGLLVLLVIYVVYRTLCRKRLLKVLEKIKMKSFPDEYPSDVFVEKTVTNYKQDTTELISERAKLLWVERAKISEEVAGSNNGGVLLNDAASCVNGMDGCNTREINRTSSIKRTTRGDICTLGNCVSHPPEIEEDAEVATAHWIQNVRAMDLKERQLNGIILKIPPDLVSHNAKTRMHFHSVTEYGEVNEVSYQRNKSLPSLVDEQERFKFSYAFTNIHKQCRSLQTGTHISLEKEELHEHDSNSHGTSRNVGQGSLSLHSTTVPVDICPIVKVQHYHSRCKRRLISFCPGSSDEVSSASSEYPVQVNSDSAERDAKCTCLQADDSDACPQRRCTGGDHVCVSRDQIAQNCLNEQTRPCLSETSV
ncbi:uncharacterized protein LOC127876102 [Dreissena polymorpha]|uniref:Uncharacterized protein n=1 Tax=Dreissena polymorpha TaxID=45954 RepID=A0A9D4K7Z6_DREPO|nr:uncharacterized protein LOC127876102 [Dreissena polymorpha]XP_052276985.1 uncharacterized protein LOC127876102 [Dreissena polymorpha]XP_052276986.1 uncharacterized protein LOC127876102 [Dreissena polymorpha]XP_052276987.1 uncharacterized protein LOC127876102 [Dreissena polymorpha]KAH3834696.1 hypothetical protein DPMN_108029 [Dreissena polymorpha]